MMEMGVFMIAIYITLLHITACFYDELCDLYQWQRRMVFACSVARSLVA